MDHFEKTLNSLNTIENFKRKSLTSFFYDNEAITLTFRKIINSFISYDEDSHDYSADIYRDITYQNLENIDQLVSVISKIAYIENNLKNISFSCKDTLKNDFSVSIFKESINNVFKALDEIGIDKSIILGGIYVHTLRGTRANNLHSYIEDNYLDPNIKLNVKEFILIDNDQFTLDYPVYLASLYRSPDSLDKLIPVTNFSNLDIINYVNLSHDDNYYNEYYINASSGIENIFIDPEKHTTFISNINNHKAVEPFYANKNDFQKGIILKQKECILPNKDICLLLSFDTTSFIYKDNIPALKNIFDKYSFINDEKESILIVSSFINDKEKHLSGDREILLDWNWNSGKGEPISYLINQQKLFKYKLLEIFENKQHDIFNYLRNIHEERNSNFNKKVLKMVKAETNIMEEYIKSLTDKNQSGIKKDSDSIMNIIKNYFFIINLIKDNLDDIWTKENTSQFIEKEILHIKEFSDDMYSTLNEKDKNIINFFCISFEKEFLNLMQDNKDIKINKILKSRI